MFNSPAADEFAAGFNREWQRQADDKQREIEEIKEAERLVQLAQERLAFIEDTAQAWEASRQLEDAGLAKERQDGLALQVKEAAERYDVGLSDLVDLVNARANGIRDDRLETERQQELERKAVQQKTRDTGWDMGM